ncbi:MAG: type II CAAX endopeptidase family protein [Candidatus Riflebacteria bacterium]
MNKHPVAWFYILAFVIAWLGWIPVAAGARGIAPFDNPYFQFLLILPAIGPALAAIIVARIVHGKAGIKELLRPLFQWRVGAIWYILAVISPVVLRMAGKVLTELLGFVVTKAQPQGNILPVVMGAFVMSLFSNPWEEIGWRGFALPRLQKRYNALVATLIVGVLGGLWHLPLFFWIGNPMSDYPFVPWFINIVAGAFLYTWLYNSAKGSILIVTLFHVALNTFGVMVSGVSLGALAILYCAVAIILIAVFGTANLSRRERVCAG